MISWKDYADDSDKEEQSSPTSSADNDNKDNIIREAKEAQMSLGCMIPALEMIRKEGYRVEEIEKIYDMMQTIVRMIEELKTANRDTSVAAVARIVAIADKKARGK